MMGMIANMLKIHEEIIKMECKYYDSNRNYDKNRHKMMKESSYNDNLHGHVANMKIISIISCC